MLPKPSPIFLLTFILALVIRNPATNSFQAANDTQNATLNMAILMQQNQHICPSQQFGNWVHSIWRRYEGIRSRNWVVKKRWESRSPRFHHWDVKSSRIHHRQFANISSVNFILVDQSGSGDYTTVQAAVNAVPVNNTDRVVIFISPGIYVEKVKIPECKPFITLQGSGNDLTTISWNDYAGERRKDGSYLKTFHSASVSVNAPYFIARGITFINSAQPLAKMQAGSPIGQAVALQVSGDKAAFFECHFIGTHDTLYDHQGRHYFKDCYIQGSVDFIFGNGRSLYKDCEMYAFGPGSLTAQKRQNASDDTGFAFVDSRILGNGQVYLGRAWGPFSRVVFLHCFMEDVIYPKGWDDWSNSTRDWTVFYGEYNCTGPGAITDSRVPWAYLLDEEEAYPFMDISFIDGDEWLPYT